MLGLLWFGVLVQVRSAIVDTAGFYSTHDPLTTDQYRKKPLYPLSGMVARRLSSGVCVQVPRDRVIGHDSEIRKLRNSIKLNLSQYVSYKIKIKSKDLAKIFKYLPEL